MDCDSENQGLAELEAEIAAARARTELEDQIEPRAVKAWYDAGRGLVMFELKNGCIFGFPPPEDPYWELADATPEQLAKVKVDFGGRVLLWDEIDAGIVVPGLLLHLLNVKAWYAKWLGGAKSEAKAGRPPAAASGRCPPASCSTSTSRARWSTWRARTWWG